MVEETVLADSIEQAKILSDKFMMTLVKDIEILEVGSKKVLEDSENL